MQLSESTLLPLIAVIAGAIALVTDLRFRRIPNWLTGSTLLVGLAMNSYLRGLDGTVSSLEGMALGLTLLLPLWWFRVMGAGDVKLLAAFGAVLGPQMLLSVMVYASVIGGLQSLFVLGRLKRIWFTLFQLFVLRVLPARSGAKAPYAVALASGLCVALAHPLMLTF
jgi:prepilin peptidase CpaA